MRSTGDQLQLLPERRVEVRELPLVPPVEVGDVEVVEVRGIVDGVDHPVRLVVDVDGAHRARARCDRCRPSRCEIDAIQLRRALHAGLEIERAAGFGPRSAAGIRSSSVDGETRRRAAGARRQPDLRMRLLRHRAHERDRLSVRRPARRVVALL